MEIVVRASHTRMPHVPGEVWEHGVYIHTGGNPPVQITEREMMPEVIRPWLVTTSLRKARSLPYFAKYQAYA